MRVGVLGAGAMGSVFGARLQSAGAEVVLFDINGDHVREIHTRGLRLDDAAGEHIVGIPATTCIAEVEVRA